MRLFRSVCFGLFIALQVIFGSIQTHAREGDSNADGRITGVKNGYFEIVVEGYTEDGPLWLGCTFYPGTENERDLEPVRVRGKFEVSFDVPTESRYGGIVDRARSLVEADYAVALWGWKVDKSECRNGSGGRPCTYCRKNGFHMEGRVDMGRGTYSVEEKGAERRDLELGQAEAARREAQEQDQRETDKPFSERLGVRVEPDEAEDYEGMIVVAIYPGSRAGQHDIQKGDLIYELALLDDHGEPEWTMRPGTLGEFDGFCPAVGSLVDVRFLSRRLGQDGQRRTLKYRAAIRF